ncbi:trace amine-associated receptor 7a-like [Lytechinus pictus]|uniref:trace amine-associated receptor 7a-like n=1 Tax=Lytechinus pictus TaxID=7653 RepID=UPI0030B9B574
MARSTFIVTMLFATFNIGMAKNGTSEPVYVTMETLNPNTTVSHLITNDDAMTSSMVLSTAIPDVTRAASSQASHSAKSSSHRQSAESVSVETSEGVSTSTNGPGSKRDLTESFMTDKAPVVPWSWGSITWSWWSSMTLVSSILGIMGNLLVIIVIWQRRMMSRSTDTLIGSLAVADFCTSVFILPLPTAITVPSSILGEFYCRFIFTSYFFWLSVGSSIYTLTLISLERLIAVKYPIEFSRFSSRRYTSLAVLSVWSMVMVIDLFLILTASVDGSGHTCIVRFRSIAGQYSVGILIFMVYFLVPTTVMLLAQAVTAYILHKKSKRFHRAKDQNRSNPSYNLLVAKNRVIKMLFMVVMIFIICWGPNNIAYFLYNVGVISPSYLYGETNQILTLLAFYNSCLNPVVYTVRHQKFRAAIRGLFTGSKTEKDALFEYKTDAKSTSQFKEENEPKV